VPAEFQIETVIQRSPKNVQQKEANSVQVKRQKIEECSPNTAVTAKQQPLTMIRDHPYPVTANTVQHYHENEVKIGGRKSNERDVLFIREEETEAQQGQPIMTGTLSHSNSHEAADPPAMPKAIEGGPMATAMMNKRQLKMRQKELVEVNLDGPVRGHGALDPATKR
jgi:hypothetical protein